MNVLPQSVGLTTSSIEQIEITRIITQFGNPTLSIPRQGESCRWQSINGFAARWSRVEAEV